MATLTGELISETYDSLLKVTDNNTITGVKKRITDGFGNEIPLQLSSTDIEIDGTLILSSLTDLEVATKFLSLKADNSVAYRTASEVLSDIGGASSSDLSAYVTLATNQTITGVKTFSVDTIINGINIGRGGGNLNSNTRFGNNSLPTNTTGVNNTAIGFNVLASNVIGSSNTAIGHQALPNSNSDNNTAVGLSSLFSLSSGNNNISFGSESGWKISGGADLTIANNSVFLGYATKALANNQTNQIVIGYDVTGNGSNTVTIGNSSITNNYFTGNIRGGAFIKSGGLSTEFLKADGSVDSNTYALASSLTGYVTLDTTQTITGTKTFDNPIYLKQRASFIEPPTGYSLISSTDLGFWFANKRAGGAFQSFNLDVTTITNGSVRTYIMPNANGTLALTSDIPSLSGYVTLDTDQTITGAKTLTSLLIGTRANFTSSGSGDTLGINHSSGSGIALYITKAGNGEGIYINKSSGSGNAVTIVGTLNATTLVKNGGTSSQFLKADGSVDSTSYGTGSVTSVAAITLGTSGFDLSSTVANGTTTPVITLNVPNASSIARGVLSSADWTTFNNKQNTITLTTTGSSGAATLVGSTLNIPNYGSALSAYLPLSGGTLTGALGGTSATFSGSVTSNAEHAFYFQRLSGVPSDLYSWSSDSSAAYLYNHTKSKALIYALEDGNVGLGTTSPSAKLDVNETSAGVITNCLTITNASNTINTEAGLFFAPTVATGNIRGARITGFQEDGNNAIGLKFYTGVGATISEKMRIASGGNVGIGTTSPAQKLSIGGVGSAISFDTTGLAASTTLSTVEDFKFSIKNNRGTSSEIKVGNDNLEFFTNTSERMRITSGGNVLIGTTSDSGAKFQVSGTGNISGALTLASSLVSNAVAAIQFRNSGSLRWEIDRDGTESGSNAGSNLFLYRFDDAGGFLGTAMVINRSSGSFTLGNLAGTGSRAVLADANGLLSAPVSDISVKENIKTIGYGLNEVLKMNPVWFDFINDYKNYGEGRQNGNIAQEMQEIIPEAVFTTPSTGKMGINYDQLHAVYIKAIQEQQAQIEELKALINK